MCGAVRYTIAESRSLSAFAIATAAGRIRERPVIFVHHSTVTIAGEPADFEDVGSSGLKVLRGIALAAVLTILGDGCISRRLTLSLTMANEHAESAGT